MSKKPEKKVKKQGKDLEKLRESVEELQGRSAVLASSIGELRAEQEKSRRQLSTLLERLAAEPEDPEPEDPEVEEVEAMEEAGEKSPAGTPLPEAPRPDPAPSDEQRSMLASWVMGQDGAPEATDAASRKAGELGVDLHDVEGTGSGGRITVKDVEKNPE